MRCYPFFQKTFKSDSRSSAYNDLIVCFAGKICKEERRNVGHMVFLWQPHTLTAMIVSAGAFNLLTESSFSRASICPLLSWVYF